MSQAVGGGFERRRSERIALPARGSGISVVGARVVNVSAHGMLIESLVPMEREQRLTLRVVVEGENADVEARVACCSVLAQSRRRVYGVGLEFAAFPEAAHRRLLDTLDSLKPGRGQA
ncbi:MAG TPA: PilZ domain-containing protein [Vicinamibacteria bacterium]|nr:PilZ domain-containing protein [Vicinamibacteria bacterium]